MQTDRNRVTEVNEKLSSPPAYSMDDHEHQKKNYIYIFISIEANQSNCNVSSGFNNKW